MIPSVIKQVARLCHTSSEEAKYYPITHVHDRELEDAIAITEVSLWVAGKLHTQHNNTRTHTHKHTRMHTGQLLLAHSTRTWDGIECSTALLSAGEWVWLTVATAKKRLYIHVHFFTTPTHCSTAVHMVPSVIHTQWPHANITCSLIGAWCSRLIW